MCRLFLSQQIPKDHQRLSFAVEKDDAIRDNKPWIRNRLCDESFVADPLLLRCRLLCRWWRDGEKLWKYLMNTCNLPYLVVDDNGDLCLEVSFIASSSPLALGPPPQLMLAEDGMHRLNYVSLSLSPRLFGSRRTTKSSRFSFINQSDYPIPSLWPEFNNRTLLVSLRLVKSFFSFSLHETFGIFLVWLEFDSMLITRSSPID